MLKRKFISALALAAVAATAVAQGAVSLDSCRSMALANNKEIRLATLKIEQAGYQKDEAAAAYKPKLDFEAAYTYNQKKISLIAEDAYLPVKTFDLSSQSYQYSLVTNPMTGEPVLVDGSPIPSQVALLPKSALTYNIHNVFAGALTITQPIYMGGKIKAMNEITRYAEELACSMRNSKVEDVIYNVDAAYWQVVSLKAKQRLAQSYVELVESLDNDIKAMLKEGVATRAQLLAVDVKLNEAQVDLTRVNNGLVLARMLLAQTCGMPVSEQFTLVDEDRETVAQTTLRPATFNMDNVYAKRSDLHSLELATKVYDEKIRVARSEMLPQIAAIGAYHVMNPNSYDGFENKFGFAFTVGIMAKIPIWHWGEHSSKIKQAQVDARMKRVELEDAREKVTLQVNQASFRYQEAQKTLETTIANLEKAEENLRMSQLAFKEGVSTADDVLTAQTAWLKANSEKIDAEIDVRLCDVYLSKVMGELRY